MKSSADLLPFVRKLERYVRLTEADRAEILGLPYELRTLVAGETLVEQGQKSADVFVVLSGFLARASALHDGNQQIISIYVNGDGVDLQKIAGLDPGYGLSALTDLTVAAIATPAVRELCQSNGRLHSAILAEISADASIQRQWTLNVGRRHARERLAHLLCELGQRQVGSDFAQVTYFDVPLTQQQLADATGLTSVHINRTIQSLRKEGLVTPRNRHIRITHAAGLVRLAGFETDYLGFSA